MASQNIMLAFVISLFLTMVMCQSNTLEENEDEIMIALETGYGAGYGLSQTGYGAYGQRGYGGRGAYDPGYGGFYGGASYYGGYNSNGGIGGYGAFHG